MTTARAYGGKRRKDLAYDPDAWSTPQWLFDELNAEFKFVLDVCASPENAKCPVFYTSFQDGLTQAWGLHLAWLGLKGAAFCYPPFSQVEQWLEKAWGQTHLPTAITVVCLVKADTSTKWFRRFYPLAAEVRFLKRIQFVPPPRLHGEGR